MTDSRAMVTHGYVIQVCHLPLVIEKTSEGEVQVRCCASAAARSASAVAARA